MHPTLKRVARPAAELVAYTAIRSLPLGMIPARVGQLVDVATPATVIPNSEPSPLGTANINIILALLERTASIAGDIAECGVFRGATLVPTALTIKRRGLAKRVHGFDSFEGFDDAIDRDLALGGADDGDKRRGGFSHTSYQMVASKVLRLGLADIVQLHRGYFRDTLHKSAHLRFSFVHLDCDIYDSYRECLEFFYPRLTPGGIILLDEYNDPPWPGCNMAVDEFLADKVERPVEIERDNYLKWYIAKAD